MKKSLFIMLFLFIVAIYFLEGWNSTKDRFNNNRSTLSSDKLEVIIIPTIHNDHQFNLNYTVAHIMALLDVISPDALLVQDDTEWLRKNCPWQINFPEVHVALAFAQEQSLPIYGDSLTAEAVHRFNTKEAIEGAIEKYRLQIPDLETSRHIYSSVLDSKTASVARDYSYSQKPGGLEMLLCRILPNRLKQISETRSENLKRAAKRLVSDIENLPQVARDYRLAVLIHWQLSFYIEQELRTRRDIKVVSVNNFLPLKQDAVERRMDFKHTAWIVSGLVDEWYGMWAPQVFPGEKIASFLARLKTMRSEDPVSKFLEARWLMQNRDFIAAELILKELASTAGKAQFPFPINGKWIRPPWSSVRDKAKLNLALIYDYKGEREKALELYKELIKKGAELNEESRALGFVYDDILAVMKSYLEQPFTGMPEEAFRHFPITGKIPPCAPLSFRK